MLFAECLVENIEGDWDLDIDMMHFSLQFKKEEGLMYRITSGFNKPQPRIVYTHIVDPSPDNDYSGLLAIACRACKKPVPDWLRQKEINLGFKVYNQQIFLQWRTDLDEADNDGEGRDSSIPDE